MAEARAAAAEPEPAAATPRWTGWPVRLTPVPARTTVNRQFAAYDLGRWLGLYLPPSAAALVDGPAAPALEFLEDDNRGAVSPTPVATLDGLPFHLSVKGIGSSIDPYSERPLDRASAAQLSDDADLRRRWNGPAPAAPTDPVVTGELWLRGSPYGGQGLEHAATALGVSERASLTSLAGFRLAPVLAIAHFPPELEARVRSVYWYRRFAGPIVQELRLVPSNVRIYFHARSTLAGSIRPLFDRFGLDSDRRARAFERNFLASGIAVLTLFARTLEPEDGGRAYSGLDFSDVWLDKDAVVAPDGTIFFVDLEGIETARVAPEEVRERIEDQVYRSLYELTFAYEQIEGERLRRFGGDGGRRARFAALLAEAVREDPFVRLRPVGRGLELEIRNKHQEERMFSRFPILDG